MAQSIKTTKSRMRGGGVGKIAIIDFRQYERGAQREECVPIRPPRSMGLDKAKKGIREFNSVEQHGATKVNRSQRSTPRVWQNPYNYVVYQSNRRGTRDDALPSKNHSTSLIHSELGGHDCGPERHTIVLKLEVMLEERGVVTTTAESDIVNIKG